METVTIPREEYEMLKMFVLKLKLIDKTIHDDLSATELMSLQEKQQSLDFLKNQEEDIYTLNDLKGVC